MSKQIRLHTKRVNLDPSATSPNIIVLLTPVIDDNFTLFSTTIIMTQDKNTKKKKDVPQIRKVPKIYQGGEDFDHKIYI